MNKKLRIASVLLIFLSVTKVVGAGHGELKPLVDSLDNAIKQREFYFDNRQNGIDMLKELSTSIGTNTEQLYVMNCKIIEQYLPFQFDSTVVYLERNVEIAKSLKDVIKLNECYINLALRYTHAGMYIEAMDIFSSTKIDTLVFDQTQSANYHFAQYKLYDQLVIYSSSSELKSMYEIKRDYYRDRIVNIIYLPSATQFEFLISVFLNSRELDKATEFALEQLSRYTVNDPIYATIAFYLSEIARMQGDTLTMKQWLIRSAICDITLAIRDNISLHDFAHTLLLDGDVELAMEYMRVVLDDAKFFNSRLRMWQDAKVASDIEQAYNAHNEKVKKLTYSIFVIIFMFVFAAVGFIIKIMRQTRRLNLARTRLQTAFDNINESNLQLRNAIEKLTVVNGSLMESNKVKEEYIGNFMAICSQYIDKIGKMRRNISKLLRDDKLEELKKEYGSRTADNSEDVEQFYKMFDGIFLNLYPTFVEEFNSLLEDEAKIELRGGELLNTELRIFAMIRLGITDLSKISSLLRYSMSTIYNYRSKIKNQARCDKAEFEERIRTIGSIQQ